MGVASPLEVKVVMLKLSCDIHEEVELSPEGGCPLKVVLLRHLAANRSDGWLAKKIGQLEVRVRQSPQSLRLYHKRGVPVIVCQQQLVVALRPKELCR